MKEYYEIKDLCRQGLLKYLARACGSLPVLPDCTILDIGCGTGVPTLWLSENVSGIITALDSDSDAINYLQQKILARDLQNRINTICLSFDDFHYQTGRYNLILAEGFLNVVGFKTGFIRINDLLSSKGVLILHDEYKDHSDKIVFIENNNFTVIDTFILNEDIWWNDYYKQLESEINGIRDPELLTMFNRDMEEIQFYKTNPSLFQSVYYILLKK